MPSHRQAGWLNPNALNNTSVQPFIYWETPNGSELKDTLVVVLPPIGPEYMHCNHTLKVLSRLLVGNGFCCARIDYPGYGNSADDSQFFNFDECVSYVVRTINEIKRVNPNRKIVLLSLRSASLLASSVADCIRVDSLVFWYPYLNGAAFIRDMQLIDSELSLVAQSTFIEAGGYPIENAQAEKIKAIKLSDFTYENVQACLILVNSEQRTQTRFLAYLRSVGIDAAQLECSGLSGMAKQAELSAVPTNNISEIINWLNLRAAVDSTPIQGVHNKSVTLVNVNERALWFENKRNKSKCFGVLTLPYDKAALRECEHVCLIGNAGSGHHVGPNRLHTQLARALSAQNIATVRYDLIGLGESNNGEDSHPYPEGACATVLDLVDWLADNGVNKVSLAGLCSGAYHAFQAALTARQSDVKIEQVLLINPLFFYWQPGDSIFAPQSQSEEISKQYYASQARDVKKWLAVLLSPKKWLNIAGFISRFMCKKIMGVIYKLNAFIVGEQRSQLACDMSDVLAKDICVNLFMAEGEPGLLVLDAELDAKIREHQQFKITQFSGTDHTFSDKTSREQLISALVKTLKPK